jgi:RTX calcium-binding nonapeptide repeat (4 copies)
MKTHRLVLASATAALALGSLVVPTSAVAADTCFGLAPTIVGSGDAIVGTEGNDVILAEGVEFVRGLGGNDAICVKGGKSIDAGAGNDRVSLKDVRAPRTLVILGNGSDLYEGSDVDDRVWEDTDGADSVRETGPETTDVVRTYGGDDKVSSGSWGGVNDDQIDLGSGDDSVSLAGAPGSTARIQGGSGTDGVWAAPVAPAAQHYDLAKGIATLGGVGFADIDGFEDLAAYAVDHAVSVRGTSGPNWITVSADHGRVATLGGDDRVDVGGCGMVARGGAGADTLTVAYPKECTSYAVRLYGGGGADVLTGSLHRDVLIGNAGRDEARGDKGQDTCQAEVERSCERRRRS